MIARKREETVMIKMLLKVNSEEKNYLQISVAVKENTLGSVISL
jgi:hypothetical protein